MKKTKLSDPTFAAITGVLFALPFFILNAIVAMRIEPIYSFLGMYPAIRNTPLFPLVMLLLFPVGAFVAAFPMMQKSANGKRKFYLVNAVIALILLVVFLVIFSALGQEFYECDMLKIPNCD
jgi:hypothetical protein